jgi:hypothetical protein
MMEPAAEGQNGGPERDPTHELTEALSGLQKALAALPKREGDGTDGPPSAKETLSALPYLAAIVATLGVLFNFGYFWGDLNLFTLLTYRDHLETIVWLAAPVLFMVVIMSLVANWKYFGIVLFLPVFLAIMVAIGPSTYPAGPAEIRILNLLKGWFSLLGVAALTVVILTNIDRCSSGANKDRLFWRQMISLACLFLAILVILLGNSWFHQQLYSQEFGAEVVTSAKESKDEQTIHTRVLRIADEGWFLVRQDDPNQLTFLRKDAIKSLSEKVVPAAQ